jgi:hypothetical protein
LCEKICLSVLKGFILFFKFNRISGGILLLFLKKIPLNNL